LKDPKYTLNSKESFCAEIAPMPRKVPGFKIIVMGYAAEIAGDMQFCEHLGTENASTKVILYSCFFWIHIEIPVNTTVFAVTLHKPLVAFSEVVTVKLHCVSILAFYSIHALDLQNPAMHSMGSGARSLE
jgi:hypothetical protein